MDICTNDTNEDGPSRTHVLPFEAGDVIWRQILCNGSSEVAVFYCSVLFRKRTLLYICMSDTYQSDKIAQNSGNHNCGKNVLEFYFEF